MLTSDPQLLIQLFKKGKFESLANKRHRTVLVLAGVLVDLHASPADPASRECGPVNMEAVQQVVPAWRCTSLYCAVQVVAAKWAIDVINNQSLPHELSIGK